MIARGTLIESGSVLLQVSSTSGDLQSYAHQALQCEQGNPIKITLSSLLKGVEKVACNSVKSLELCPNGPGWSF